MDSWWIIIPSITKLGALIIFSFLVFRDFVINWESPPQIIKISFSGLNKLLITPVRELITPFKIIENPFKKDLLIADFGTILSITKLNSNGSIIGGQLLPGFLTQLKSMEQSTKNLKVPQKNDIPVKDFLINTEEAILKGVINSLTGVINSLFNPEKDILIICGGDSQLITKYLKTKKENIINTPNLVMEGMIIHHLSIKN